MGAASDHETEDQGPELDALGLDKRRPVTGRSYGPSRSKRLIVYLTVLAVIGALILVGAFLVSEFDETPPPGEAPWAQPGAQPQAPAELE